MAVNTMKKGALDFIQKPFDEEELWSAWSSACSSMPAKPLPTSSRPPPAKPCWPSSPGREAQVLERIVAGRLNKQIADDLGISIKTVEAHRANIMEKLGANTVADSAEGGPGLGPQRDRLSLPPRHLPASQYQNVLALTPSRWQRAIYLPLLTLLPILFLTTMTAQIIDGKALPAQLRTEVSPTRRRARRPWRAAGPGR